MNIVDALASFGDGLDVRDVRVSRNDDGSITLTMTAREIARESIAVPVPRQQPKAKAERQRYPSEMPEARRAQRAKRGARKGRTQSQANAERAAQIEAMWQVRMVALCRWMDSLGDGAQVSNADAAKGLAPAGLSKSAAEDTLKRARERELVRLAGYNAQTGGAAARLYSLMPDGVALARGGADVDGSAAEIVAPVIDGRPVPVAEISA